MNRIQLLKISTSIGLIISLFAYSCKKDDAKPSVIATIKTASITNTTSTGATSGGYITPGTSVTSRGVIWSINPHPTVDLSTKTQDGSGEGDFVSIITNLTPATTYYIKAYAINKVGIAYGSEISFTTLPALPTVTTENVTNVKGTTCQSGGSVSSDGGAAIMNKGVILNTMSHPTLIQGSIGTSDGIGLGDFTSNVVGLLPNTTYYLRAYAVNYIGTAYGNEISFTTNSQLAIGDIYAGGLIFYLDNTGAHGLVVTTTDVNSGLPWAKPSTPSLVTSATGTAVGTGQDNTNKIVSKYGPGDYTDPYAAWACDQLIQNGYNDWFLPSKDEVNLIYTNLQRKGCPIDTSPCPTSVGNFTSIYFSPYFMWTSTEETGASAWIQYFSNGNQQAVAKSGGVGTPFRAVRAF